MPPLTLPNASSLSSSACTKALVFEDLSSESLIERIRALARHQGPVLEPDPRALSVADAAWSVAGARQPRARRAPSWLAKSRLLNPTPAELNEDDAFRQDN